MSQSILWQLQYEYYQAQGINAWGQGQTPSYITSNSFIARQYAEVVFGFFRDLHRKGIAQARVYLFEPGAGSGQFAFLFLKALAKACEVAAFPVPEFCYIISDFAERNVQFWESHPQLQPFLDRGQIDFAVFDAGKDTTIKLRHTGKEIKAGSLQTPLIVLANYFFDSIPQDLFYISQGKIEEALPSLTVEGAARHPNPVKLLKSIQMEFEFRETASKYYPESAYNDILRYYQEILEEGWLLFPAPAFRMLDRLQSWTNSGLLLLTGDKGVQTLAELKGMEMPEIILHGGFSLTVNYHAFHQYVSANQGLGMMPAHLNPYLNVHCFLFQEDAETFQELRNAFASTIGEFGPDDFFILKKVIQSRIPKMKWKQIMATIRQSHYDTRVFQKLLPRMRKLVIGLQAWERESMLATAAKVWEQYYPISSGDSLAIDLGQLSFVLDDFASAKTYLQHALKTVAGSVEIFFTLALCFDQLEDYVAAEKYL
ncbi:MAG TPA: hypothetical protein ENJ82_09975, partial [Bacteroidetes bacterium]|nr:hypothetical protein [Bacteroidota bacterium]